MFVVPIGERMQYNTTCMQHNNVPNQIAHLRNICEKVVPKADPQG